MNLTPEEQDLIIQHRNQAKAQEAAAWKPRKLSSYSDAEKIEKFDVFYGYALEEFNRIKKERFIDDSDFDTYMGEAIMELLGSDVFDAAINKMV